MLKSFFHKLKGDRKFFAIVFFIITLIFVIGIIIPRLTEYKRENWSNELSGRITNIETEINQIFKQKEDNLLSIAGLLKQELARTLNPKNSSYGALIKLVNDEQFSNYSVEVLAPNGKLIAWNQSFAIPQNDVFPLAYPIGEIHFYNTELVTYLTVTETVLVDNDQFYFLISLPIEKHYKLRNAYYKQISFSQNLSDKFLTQVNVNYNPFIVASKDGRSYTFPLVNNQKNKIGSVSFMKPSLDNSVNSIYDQAGKIQSILAAIGFLLMAFGFRNEYKGIKYRSVKLILFAIYCAAFRLMLYYVGIPTQIMNSSLTEPSFFSSTFAGGIVKSPVEFLITNIFLLLVLIKAFRYLTEYLNLGVIQKNKKLWVAFLLFLPVLFVSLLTLRGLSASIKSVIFDSTLRYFKEPNLIPNLASIIMNLNVLLIGLSTVLFLSAIVLILFLFLPKKGDKYFLLTFLLVFILFQISGILFIEKQHEPLITPLLSIIFITIFFLLIYKLLSGNLTSIYNYVYATVVASIVTITLMNFFNLHLEKTSLKTTALEINRSNDNLLRFLISETLENLKNNPKVKDLFTDNDANYDAAAFLLWSNSSLQRESLGSSLTLYNRNQKIIGRFGVGIDTSARPVLTFTNINSPKPEIFESTVSGNSINRIFTGLIPVAERGIILGYVAASISFNMQNLGAQNIPDFLESKTNILNSVIDVRHLKIFEFSDSKLIQVYGDIYPSRDQIKPILNADFSPDNEAWLNLSLNGINYVTFVLKTGSGESSKITSVSLKGKNISWELYNFFKIFIVHSIFIMILLLTLLIINFKKIKYSFRAQLLFSFLLVSILPVLILAIYNRQVVKERSQTAIFNELSERSRYIEQLISEEIKEIKNNYYNVAFDNAGKDLGISFAIFDGPNQIYNSKNQYYNTGLFSEKLDPQAYYELNYLSYREYLTQEKVENFIYDAYYRRIVIGNRDFILGVNDAFNKVRLTFSVIDVDVFLFGVYSFATLIIIIISTFLADKISSPIRRLTKATTAVAQGDLSVELQNNERGEIRELLNGFNTMTKELQKTQSELADLERENAWKEMAKQVAHEIKNPLTPMKLAVQQLIASYKDKNKNFDSIFNKVSKTILNQIENLNLIASEFSRFARMPNFNMEDIDLIPVVIDTVNLYVHEKVKINVVANPDSIFIEGDNSQLRRLFINLIRNSIQAGADRVDISIDGKDNKVIIIVEDNGKGIPEDIKDKIFDSNFTTKEKGMGLGLKLAKRFLEGIGGSILLIDSSDTGTKFEITMLTINKDDKK